MAKTVAKGVGIMEPEDYINLKNENLWDFDILDGVGFLNANRIHPLKQREIETIIRKSSQDKHISGIIIFGSATEFRCSSKSDIDMFIVRDDNRSELDIDITDTDSELDILFNKNAGDRIKAILKAHGVLVYSRRQGDV